MILLLLRILLYCEGEYFCYDIPAALYSQMDEYFGKPDDFETLFSLLYTLYAVPNIVLPFFGGYFTDKWGARICLLIFTWLITIGQVIFAIGLSIKSWPIMYLGRIIFGCGGGTLNVANSAILSVWFRDKELAFALGLNLSISRIGSVVNNLTSPVITDSLGIVFALWFGVLLCVCSVLSAIVINVLDLRVEAEIRHSQGLHRLLSCTDEVDDEQLKGLFNVADGGSADLIIVNPFLVADDNHQSTGTNNDVGDIVVDDDNDDGNGGGRRQVDIPSLKERLSLIEATNVNHHAVDDQDQQQQRVEPSLRDVLAFEQVFWIVCCSCVIVYGTMAMILMVVLMMMTMMIV